LQGLSSRCGVLRRFKIKVWLTLLFVLMVVTVCIVIHFYKQDMVEVDIGNALRFYIDSRRLHVDRGDATDVLTARLGDSIPRNLLPFNCLGAGEDPRTRLALGASLRDCVSLAPAHWYGGGLVAGQPWPLERWSRPPRPYVGGDARRGEYGGVLERYWLSSRGAYVRAGDDAPLVVSVNDGGDGDLCLAAPSPGACGVAGEATTLTYSVCVAGDARLAHEHYLSRAPRPACVPRDAVSRVVWTTDSGLDGEADGEAATRLAEGVSRRGGGGGVVVVAGWEARPGDLAFDARRFPDPRAVVAAIAARNLSVAL
ncbi:PREDICTED: uncharacterized family 31 glucosidase KIAA1161-like, partial [Priapulus caudatus]|uniref:Uncharacterized family 31 glucosidase KIAA1161-like n=1 Tax=Priapulus caudatus TaxID=37621 RepID=A0ABM1F7I8_PRICU